jgi:hypothetical protein
MVVGVEDVAVAGVVVAWREEGVEEEGEEEEEEEEEEEGTVVVVRVVEVKSNWHSTWYKVIAFLDTVCMQQSCVIERQILRSNRLCHCWNGYHIHLGMLDCLSKIYCIFSP